MTTTLNARGRASLVFLFNKFTPLPYVNQIFLFIRSLNAKEFINLHRPNFVSESLKKNLTARKGIARFPKSDILESYLPRLFFPFSFYYTTYNLLPIHRRIEEELS